MKRLFTIMILFVVCLLLNSCFFTSTKFPDMIEYMETEVLEVAKEKYNIQKFYFTGIEVRKSYDQQDELSYDNYDCLGIFTNIKNPDNLEKSLTSFAGKNGGHDIQGMYKYFACYVALVEDTNGIAKFIFYNTNINKNENISDTIGSSDYPYDLHPSKINTKFMDEITWDSLRVNFKQQYHDEISIRGLLYCFDKPTIITSSRKSLVQFYEEDDKVVFDIFSITLNDQYGDYNFDDMNQSIKSKELIYSTSKKYDFHFSKYGVDPNMFFDIQFSVEQSIEADYLDLISGTITVKDIGKEVVSYGFNYKIIYSEKDKNGKIVVRDVVYGSSELKNNRFGLLIDQIEGHDHKVSTTVTITNFHIIYKNDESK